MPEYKSFVKYNWTTFHILKNRFLKRIIIIQKGYSNYIASILYILWLGHVKNELFSKNLPDCLYDCMFCIMQKISNYSTNTIQHVCPSRNHQMVKIGNYKVIPNPKIAICKQSNLTRCWNPKSKQPIYLFIQFTQCLINYFHWHYCKQ